MQRRFLLVSLALASAGLQGCAAPGPAFSSLEPVAAGKGHLYLYRKSGVYAPAAKYKVHSKDGGLVGELYNGSYLLLPLSPGRHQFTVDERGFAGPKSFDIDVQAGKSYFVEYDSGLGMILGTGHLSFSRERSEEQALQDLRGLNRAN